MEKIPSASKIPLVGICRRRREEERPNQPITQTDSPAPAAAAAGGNQSAGEALLDEPSHLEKLPLEMDAKIFTNLEFHDAINMVDAHPQFEASWRRCSKLWQKVSWVAREDDCVSSRRAKKSVQWISGPSSSRMPSNNHQQCASSSVPSRSVSADEGADNKCPAFQLDMRMDDEEVANAEIRKVVPGSQQQQQQREQLEANQSMAFFSNVAQFTRTLTLRVPSAAFPPMKLDLIVSNLLRCKNDSPTAPVEDGEDEGSRGIAIEVVYNASSLVHQQQQLEYPDWVVDETLIRKLIWPPEDARAAPIGAAAAANNNVANNPLPNLNPLDFEDDSDEEEGDEEDEAQQDMQVDENGGAVRIIKTLKHRSVMLWAPKKLVLKHCNESNSDLEGWIMIEKNIEVLKVTYCVTRHMQLWRMFHNLRTLDVTHCVSATTPVYNPRGTWHCSGRFPSSLRALYVENCDDAVLAQLGLVYPVKCMFHEIAQQLAAASSHQQQGQQLGVQAIKHPQGQDTAILLHPLPVAHQIFRDVEHVSVAGCRGFTDSCATLLEAEYAPNLKTLNVSGTGVTPQWVAQFRQERPNVTIVYGNVFVHNPRFIISS